MNSTTNNTMLPKGTLLHGSYRIDQYLASGGFGNTYVAINQFGEKVAVKEFFMHEITCRDEGASTVSVSISDNRPKFEGQLAKFKEEAKRLRGIHNKHIVQVHDLFDENGTAYYVMDYIEGGSVKDTIANMGHAMEEKQIWNIFLQILDALEAVHAKGFYHLDVKPSNIMLDESGNALLIDFGASKHMKAEGGATTDSAPSCTPGYAPSELMEQNMSKVGPWTDLYSLGATLYFMVSTIKPPTLSDLSEGPTDAFNFPDGISRKLQDIIVWMMSTVRSQRPQSVAEVKSWMANYVETAEKVEGVMNRNPTGNASDVERVADDGATVVLEGPMPAQPKPEPIEQEKTRNNNHWWIYFLVAFVIALVVSFVFLQKRNATSNEPAQTEKTDSVSQKSVKDLHYTVEGIGSCTYNGAVSANNIPQGKGKATFTNGSAYDGDWSNGKMEGHGTFTFGNGDVYVGTMKNNEFKEGTITFASDGNYFKGPFVDGQPDYSNGHEYNKNGKRLK